jgi:serine/threonine-protein kinase
MANQIGQSLGRYQILELLGEGGMAIVYKAYDNRLERDVAIKVIRTDLFGSAVLERMLKRFEREAKALAKLSHPHIIKIIDFGEHAGAPYFVMEYMPGGTLKQSLGKPMPWQEVVKILLPLLGALEYAHDHNIIHRDIKPANILMTEKGQPMLTDFGIAKVLETEETATMTGTGVGVGTPEYMAPEQWMGQSTAQSDIYSLGVVMYEMLTGRKPYTSDTPAGVLVKQAKETLPRPGKFVTDLPQRVENILIKALAKNPKDRYQTMTEFARALESLQGAKTASVREKWAGTRLPFIPRKTLVYLGTGIVLISILAVITALVTRYYKPLNDLALNLFISPTHTTTNTPMVTTTPELGIGSAIIGDDGTILVYVPGGEFMMGSDSIPNEQPVRSVKLEAFWIDQTEVTNARYAKCIDTGKCTPPKDIDHFNNTSYSTHPVVYANWEQAKAYCSWAGRRLPTEGEWEKAARGTDGRTYPWGEGLDCSLANYSGCKTDTTPVGSYEGGKSTYGAYDMAGNAWEWVNDWYSETYYKTSPLSNPSGPDAGDVRVLRGGAYSGSDRYLRSASRDWYNPMSANFNIGFRCARDISP